MWLSQRDLTDSHNYSLKLTALLIDKELGIKPLPAYVGSPVSLWRIKSAKGYFKLF